MAAVIYQQGVGEVYRDFVMYPPSHYSDPTLWTAHHKAADDAGDDRSASAKSRSDLMEEIDEWYADHSWERQEIYRLRDVIRQHATRFQHCSDMIASSFGISGTLRAERAEKARHYALEAKQAVAA